MLTFKNSFLGFRSRARYFYSIQVQFFRNLDLKSRVTETTLDGSNIFGNRSAAEALEAPICFQTIESVRFQSIESVWVHVTFSTANHRYRFNLTDWPPAPR